MIFKNLEDAKEFIFEITNKYKSLISLPYRIHFSNRMTRSLATCTEHRLCGKPIKYTFKYNLKFLLKYLDTPNIIENVILHELAHAIVGGEHNHDKIWKAQHISMGGDGERLFKEVA